ncbi:MULTISPECIES: MFS transporter [unclassified Streptomyces]|uniref:MFS transporter n=1 Tax=unclassified Streptomyces TaxID=2593676 RepID=UPI000DBA9A5E|nr:MFS transporter [Streptomyces sp. PsTaAH-137]MYT74750.1 MFS transporter [Streptomyces sp. SID8367]RAJ91737.1 MFS transporter [Streptomyces sp. PsTaAH-137]
MSAQGGTGTDAGTRAGTQKVRAVVGLLIAFELVSGFLQGAAVPLVPEIRDWQGITTGQAQWFTSVQYLAAAISVPAFGRLGDLYGHRRMIRVALGTIAAGTVLVAFAPNLTVLLLGRALMGPLAALLPLEIGLVRDRLSVDGGRRAVGMLVGALTLGTVLGHGLVGPVLSLLGDLRATLIVLAVAAVSCLVLSFTAIPESRTRGRGRMDWSGAALLALALVTLLGTVSRGAAWGWASAPTLGGLLLAAVLLAVWIKVQLVRPHALVDVRAVARRQSAPYYASGFVLGAVMLGGQSVAVSFMAENPAETGYGFDLAPWQISLYGVIPNIMAFVGSALCAALAARIGYRKLLLVSFGLLTVGYFGLLGVHAGLAPFAVANALVGVGCGLALGGLPTVIVEGSATDRTASATAVYNNLKTLGGSVGGAVFAVALGSFVLGGTDTPSLTAYLAIWIGGGAACALAVLVQLGLSRGRSAARASTAPAPAGSVSDRAG